MSLKIGIVGLPNVGKSTLFIALTKKSVDASNYPFCTIEPNVGVVAVPDERLEQLATISKPEKILPTTIEFVDIAGLVKGAHKGEGLGNAFLSHIREVDAICHVMRNFNNPDVTHVAGSARPKDDYETIILELIFADMALIEKRLNALEKKGRATQEKDILAEIAVLEKALDALQKEKPVKEIVWTEEEQVILKPYQFLTLKPELFVINTDDAQNTASDLPEKRSLIMLNAKTEAELATLTPEEVEEYLQELKLEATGLDKLIKTAYELLNLITYFTTGPQETRAWTVAKGTLAPQAAGVIHTDFEKGFIRAEVISYEDFITSGGEAMARDKGLLRIEGKNYEMQDGDVCHFRIGT